MGRGETSRRSYGSDRGWTTRPVSSPAHGHPVSHPPLTALWPWRPLCCPPLWFQQRQNTSTSCTGQGGAREHQGRAGMWEWPGAQGGRPLPSLSSLPGHKLAASPLERVPAPGPGLTATAAAFLASPQRSRQSPSASLTPLPHQLGCGARAPAQGNSQWPPLGGSGVGGDSLPAVPCQAGELPEGTVVSFPSGHSHLVLAFPTSPHPQLTSLTPSVLLQPGLLFLGHGTRCWAALGQVDSDTAQVLSSCNSEHSSGTSASA